MRIGRLDMHIGIVARGDNGENKPWFGFCYGSWLPKFSYSNGKIVQGMTHKYRIAARDLTFRWLCFFGFVTLWYRNHGRLEHRWGIK